MKTNTLYRYTFFALLIVGTFFLGYYFSREKKSDDTVAVTGAVSVAPTASTSVAVKTPTIIPYASPAYGFRIEYPSTYYLQAREMNVETSPYLVAVLVEDTQEHRDLLDGKLTAAREGPTGITINVYRNTKKQTLTEWLPSDTNWNIGDKSPMNATVSGMPGASYRWSGLYEGGSVVVMNGPFIYVFSVSWLTPEDQIVNDFSAMLKRVEFLP